MKNKMKATMSTIVLILILGCLLAGCGKRTTANENVSANKSVAAQPTKKTVNSNVQSVKSTSNNNSGAGTAADTTAKMDKVSSIMDDLDKTMNSLNDTNSDLDLDNIK